MQRVADMKWNMTVAVVTGFVLALALAFGGRIISVPPAAPPSHISN
jgi:hypothetical protein